MKTFKQILAEARITEIGHGIFYDDFNETFNTTRDGYNWLQDNLGLRFTVEQKPHHTVSKTDKLADSYDFFSIDANKLISQLFKLRSINTDKNERINIESYRFIEPETREFAQKLINAIGSVTVISMNDKHIDIKNKYKNLYLFPR